MKKRIKLIALNPNGLHNTSTYLLKAYAEKKREICEQCEIILEFYDAVFPMQSNAEDLYLQQIIESNPEVIGFSTYCWNIEVVLKLVEKLKQVLPKVLIFLGGPEATGKKDILLQRYSSIDCLLVGEGEIAFQKFLLYLIRAGQDLETVPNLVWRKEDKIIENAHEYIKCLDEIPMIYSNGLSDPNKIGGALYSFETKRGCEYKCTYCLHHKGFHEIREFSLEYVYKELSVLLKSNLKYIWIIDPCFNENEKRSMEILEYIDRHNHKNIEFGFEIRNETMSDEFIMKICSMKWIRFIALGLQSLSNETLDIVNRKFNKERFEENIRQLKRYARNLTVHVDLIYGLPKQTIEEYKKSIDYVLNLECEVFFQPLKVLPGAELTKQVEEYGIKYDVNPPYSVIETKCFPYSDMHKAMLINGVLNIFQSQKDIKKGLMEIKKRQRINYSLLFLQIGEYLWENGYRYIFANYYRISTEKLVNTIEKAVCELYKEKLGTMEYNNQLIQLDWGSIAIQIDML